MYVNPASLRRAAERRVIRLLMAGSARSRAELARRSGISAVTVGKTVDHLVSAGLLRELERATKPPRRHGKTMMGRPPRLVTLEAVTPRFFAIELGVRETRVATLPVAGPTDSMWRKSLKTPRTPNTFIARLGHACQTARIEQPWGILVSVPGVVNERENRILYSPNLHWTEGRSLLAKIGTLLGAGLCAVQEIRALALGCLARAEHDDSFILADFGDGVGSAVMSHGRLLEGPLPLTGEIGHTPVPGNTRACGCGGTGCLETLLSRRGLLQTHREQTGSADADWDSFIQHSRNQPLKPWLRRAIDAAATVVAGAVNVIGVRRVVLTGELIELGDAVVERFRKGINAAALWGRFGEVECRGAPRRRFLGLSIAAIQRILLPELPHRPGSGSNSNGA
jgi:predicted NBD/HSP70 family sugar kinase